MYMQLNRPEKGNIGKIYLMGKKISVDMSWVLKECEAINKESKYYLTTKSGYIEAIGNAKKQNIQR